MTTLKCHRCAERAAIRMRQHRLSLCKDHYIEWFIEQTERAIKKYHMFTPEERVLVAVSGGKDSLALWDVLWKLNYAADGLYINLGIDSDEDYSDESERYAKEFAEQRGLHLHVINVAEMYGETIPQIARRTRRGRYKPCSACGLVKRHEMNRVAHDLGYPILATAHNLDDEVAILFGNVLMWQTELLARQSPVLEGSDHFVRKIKPFIRFYERETAAYTLLRGIPYIEEECPYAVGSKQLHYKELINKMEEEQPGVKLAFFVGFLNAKEKGAFGDLPQAEKELVLTPCPNCGQPTTSEGLCAFCRTVNSTGRPG
jgi:tRNA-5-methyluridine54 2-sulfurtransferase